MHLVFWFLLLEIFASPSFMGHHEHQMHLARRAGGKLTNGIAKHYRKPPRVGSYKVKLVDMWCRSQPKNWFLVIVVVFLWQLCFWNKYSWNWQPESTWKILPCFIFNCEFPTRGPDLRSRGCNHHSFEWRGGRKTPKTNSSHLKIKGWLEDDPASFWGWNLAYFQERTCC